MPFDLDKMYCGAVGRGDIVVCDLDGEEKVMVVLQDKVLNEGLPTVVCVAVEPHQKGDETLVNEVLLKSYEIGLGQDGICMPHKVYTIDRRAISSKKGELGEERIEEIFEALDVTCGRFRDRKY